MKNKKISVDFDSTLSTKRVQEFVKYLIEEGVEVHVVTTRREVVENSPDYNKDLFLVTDNLAIPRRNVFFTYGTDKWWFLRNKGFLFHLDDDVIELEMIEDLTAVIPVCHFDWGLKFGGKKEWKNKCLSILDL